jgi:hypothetical protein
MSAAPDHPTVAIRTRQSQPSDTAGALHEVPNAFTSAFKELDPIPQFKAPAKLAEFLEARFSKSF